MIHWILPECRARQPICTTPEPLVRAGLPRRVAGGRGSVARSWGFVSLPPSTRGGRLIPDVLLDVMSTIGDHA